MKLSKLLDDVTLRMLAAEPGAVVRFRLLRDVMKQPDSSTELQKAKIDLWKAPFARKLSAGQCSDGSWGSFHSRNTRRKQVIPTTEVGVEQAVNLGLELSHPMVKRGHSYLLTLLKGKAQFPDRPEKNGALDYWIPALHNCYPGAD